MYKKYNFVIVQLASVVKKYNQPYNLGYESANKPDLDLSKLYKFRFFRPTINSDFNKKIGDKNVKKIQGLKNVYEAKSKDVRVYFQMDGNTVQIIAPCLKVDQRKSIELLKKYFK